MIVGLKIMTAVLAADFLSGLAHWIEDSYFLPSTPLLGRTIAKNIEHHLNPGTFLSNPWHVTIRSSFVAAALVASATYGLGYRGWWFGVALSISVFANEVHKWSHMAARDLTGIPRFLRQWSLLQTARHHLQHHASAKNSRYCVLTNIVNPVLDGCRFWRVLEGVVFLITRRRPRADASLQPPNTRVNAPVRPVKALADRASAAPVRPARYAAR
jgi:plasmanylethanolamine desaturase